MMLLERQGHLVDADDVSRGGLLEVLEGEGVLAVEGQAQAEFIVEESHAALRQVIAQPGSHQRSMRQRAGLPCRAGTGSSSVAQFLGHAAILVMTPL